MKINHNKINGIYAITPEQTLDINAVEKIIAQYKISILQYRYKTTDTQIQFNQATQLQSVCLKYHTLFIINNDINLAKKIKADGIHLGKNDGTIEQARQQLGNDTIVGVSCYNDINLAKNAQDQGADYVAFGALFPSKTKPNAPKCDLDIIAQAKKILAIPIIGIGGIDFSNQQLCINAGCDAVAMISTLFEKTA